MNRHVRDVSCGLVAVASIVCADASAFAKDPPHPLVAVDVAFCPSVLVEEVRRIVGVELGATLTTADSSASVTKVKLSCPRGLIELTVDDPVTGKRLRRTLDLSSADDRATPRLLALAIVELVTASWTELEVTPQPIVQPRERVPDADAVQAARGAIVAHFSHDFRTPPQRSDDTDLAEKQTIRVAAVTSFRTFGAYQGTLWGGGVRAGEDRFRWLGWKADILFEQGTISAFDGEIRVATVTASGAILAHHAFGPLTLRAGLGFRVGAAQVSGATVAQVSAGATSRTLLAPWGWPSLEAGLTLAAIGPLVLEVATEGGYAILPISPSANGYQSIEVRGFWYGGQLGVGLAF